MTLQADEFIRRFLLHVLPRGFHRIRHYGLLASGGRKANVARARELLAVPALEPAEPDGAIQSKTTVSLLRRPHGHHRHLRADLPSTRPASLVPASRCGAVTRHGQPQSIIEALLLRWRSPRAYGSSTSDTTASKTTRLLKLPLQPGRAEGSEARPRARSSRSRAGSATRWNLRACAGFPKTP